MSKTNQLDDPLTVTIGHEQLILRRRYEMASILNDFVIAAHIHLQRIPASQWEH
ncbi:MAG: hypothetical protein JXO48_07085 [Deltaproteobacteria bacterium]|nr:hypothetical protein [Deltaproteobacteria bacterium]